MTFKDQHRELQELVRELTYLREHNHRVASIGPQSNLLLFAEAAVVLIVLERFLRIIVGKEGNGQTIYNLFEMATDADRNLLMVQGDRDRAKRDVNAIRNALLHGDYEKAARDSGCASIEEYFKTQFASEVEALYRLTDLLMNQIDPDTGRRRPSS